MADLKNMILEVLLTPLKIYRSMQLMTSNVKTAKYEHQLAIVSIIKNEGNYIEEWVRYHQLVGVGKIYLYDNGSTDSTKDILRPYVDSGLVEIIDFPGVKRQRPAYIHALNRLRHKCKYVAFIDADEFLKPCHNGDNMVELLDKILAQDSHAGGVALNWRMFGSSHLEDRTLGKEAKGVIESFLYRAAPNKKGNNCVKTILRPEFAYYFESVHYPLYVYGYHSIDENGHIVKAWHNEIDEPQVARINHYFTKSKAEWIKRRSLGMADNKTKKRSLDEFEAHDNNDIFDDSMLYYANILNQVKTPTNGK